MLAVKQKQTELPENFTIRPATMNDLAGVVVHASPDDPLFRAEDETGDLGSSAAGVTAQGGAALIEQEQGAPGGLQVAGDEFQSPLQGGLDVEGIGKVPPHDDEQFEMIGDALRFLRGERGRSWFVHDPRMTAFPSSWARSPNAIRWQEIGDGRTLRSRSPGPGPDPQL